MAEIAANGHDQSHDRTRVAVPTGGGEAVRSTNHEGTFRFSDEIKAIQSFLE
jgi:hypothetical protein